MNIALWIAQVLLALGFVMAGINHAVLYDPNNVMPGMEWMLALPRPLLLFIGICEILGGIAVMLPWATGIQRWLTPLAAALLGVMMILALIFHVTRGEMINIVGNAVLLALAAFVAWGRQTSLRRTAPSI
jgi:uncharacterized membrane protein YphA (DoxX/SURF4 family)